MKNLLFLSVFLVLLTTGCDGWSYTVPTFPAPPPTITPSIFSPTPVILTITNTSIATITLAPVSETPTVTPSMTPTLERPTFVRCWQVREHD